MTPLLHLYCEKYIIMKVKENIAVSESGFVFDAETGESYQVNEVGHLILSFIKKEKSEEDIKVKILEEYEVEDDDLERYLYDFIRKLDEFNFLSHE